jgi:AbrB family looped-hinge helix DNA binding protein
MYFTREQNMPLVKVKQNFQVTIPFEVRKQLQIKLGDLFEATVEDDTVVLKPKVLFDRKSVGASSTEDIPKARSGKGGGQ